MEKADIIIVGGGIVGSSIAYHLLNDGFRGKVVVFEKDRTYQFASSALAAGGVRVQFANPTNILMMLYAIDFYEKFDQQMAVEGEPAHSEYRQTGYLYLADEGNWERLNRNHETQKKLGASVEKLTPAQIQDFFAEFNLNINLAPIKAAFWGRKDGRLDPYSTLQALAKKAKSIGARYRYDEVVKIAVKNNRVEGVTTRNGDGFVAPVIVNAAGAWAQEVGKMLGVDVPVEPTNHNNYVCLTPQKFKDRLPMVVFPNGSWFLGESQSKILTGMTKHDQKPGFIFEWDRDHFMENVWPRLAQWVPLFETLKLERGYAGLYEISPDECGILGEHPEIKGFYLANGFSGHGVMQSPATGKLISELIRLKRYETLDASELSLERFIKGRPIITEKMI